MTETTKSIESLPVVFDMRVEGRLVSCNIDAYKPAALTYIKEINTALVTDQNFADADMNAKFCRNSADKLKLAIEQALGQMGDINTAINSVREIAAAFDAKGLMLEKLVKAEKENRRTAIIGDAAAEFIIHVASLNTRLGKAYMPIIPADFVGVVKGLKSIDSMRDKVATELARAKIEANAVADRIQANMTTLRELATDHAFLFIDAAQLVLKANDDLTALAKSRIADHKANEAAKEEATRERILAGELAKAERAKLADEQAKAALAERDRIAETAVFEKIATVQSGKMTAQSDALVVDLLVASIASDENNKNYLSVRDELNSHIEILGEEDLKTVLLFVISLSEDCPL